MTQPYHYEQIPGWFDFETLYDESLSLARDGEILIEVGSWFGKSACYMGELIKARRGSDSGAAPACHLLCVDTWKGTPDGQHPTLAPIVAQYGGDILPHWQRNLREAGVGNFVSAFRGESVAVAGELTHPERGLLGAVPFVFIDADHSLEAVRDDVRAWWPFVREGGMLAGHDFERAATVKRAVIERFGSRVEAVAPRSWKVRREAPEQRDPIDGLCAVVCYQDSDRWTLERLLDSITPYCETVIAIDTSQEGNAFDVLYQAKQRPTLVHCDQLWTNYALMQDYMLQVAQAYGYAYALLLDADEELIALPAAADWQPDPAVRAYDVCRLYPADGTEYEVHTPRLFNLNHPDGLPEWKGERHAYAALGDFVPPRCEAFEVKHWGDDAAASAPHASRFLRDAEQFARTADTDPRACYYAAQSYYDAWRCGRHVELYRLKALDRYAQCLQMRGSCEQRYHAALQLGRLTNDLTYYWTAIDLRPRRFEARCELSQKLIKIGLPTRAIDVLRPLMTMPPSGDRWLVNRGLERGGWMAVWLAARVTQLEARNGEA